MSKELPQNQPNEEVDLGILFRAIGNLFDRLYRFFEVILNTLFSIFILGLKAILKNFKVIGISMAIAAVVGLVTQKLKQPIYASQMLVKPYFDSKYQLVTNINYYNALIEDKDFVQLGSLFKINEKDAEKLIEFEIEPGPETENDRILEYESFISQVDSTRAQDIYFDEFIQNRSIYSGSLYEIRVKSFKKDIFRSLEDGLNSTFTNTYSIKKMQKRDSLIAIDRQRILQSLIEVDSLQKVYIEVLENESNSQNKGTITLKDGMSLVQERIDTREYELLDKELQLRQALTRLDSQKVEEDVFFDTLSSFQDVGSVYSSFLTNYVIIFPILTFLLLCVIYCTKKSISFILSYEE